MNNGDASEGWLQIGDNLAGVMPAAGDGAVATGAAEATTHVDVNAAHQFFAGANTADLGQFPNITLSTGPEASGLAVQPAGAGVAFPAGTEVAAMPTGAEASIGMPTGMESQLAGGASHMLSSLIEMASSFPGAGMLAAVFQFLQMLFSPQMLMGALDPSALYAQAASAAESMLKKSVT